MHQYTRPYPQTETLMCKPNTGVFTSEDCVCVCGNKRVVFYL